MTKILKTEQGQTMAEYAFVLGVITIGVVLAFTSLASATVTALRGVVGYL
jgi:Flp pilus assembly pilin Flp